MIDHAGPHLPDLRILEIGEFALFKQNLPAQTTHIFTGENPRNVRGLAHRTFGPAVVPGLLRSLRRGEWDVVFCYPPARALWDRRQGATRAAAGLLRRLARFRTLGTTVLRARSACPLVVLDCNDEATIPAPALALLDACVAYFKRELPVDFAKAFRDTAPRYATPGAVVADPFFRRNVGKLHPLSASVPEDTARQALATPAAKTTDVFFAGALTHSTVRTRGVEQLRALADEGYVVDVCAGGLPQAEYLQRCARAWLTWSPDGYGGECFRHYEAGLCRSVPVLCQPSIYRHRPLVEGIHAIQYRPEGDDLRDAVVRALADKPALDAMARAACAHALRFHTHLRTCEYILDTALGTAAGARPARRDRPRR